MSSPVSRQRISAGRFPETLTRHLIQFQRDRVPEQLWSRRPDLWSADPAHHAVAANRLGWLDPLPLLRLQREPLTAWADRARPLIRDIVLLGMGGSSLAPDVIARIAAPQDRGPRFTMLDSTDPDSVRGLASRVDPARTLFIVASKSGTTIETLSHFAFFYAVVAKARPDPGQAFVAITDPGSGLERLAGERRFSKVFLNPADIGGRYSALSLFGIVPAALLGIDLGAVIERVQTMIAACAPESPTDENPGLMLGTLLGTAALGGADKLTLLASPALRPFGAWIEQLIAESTGKDGKGLIPIDGEPVGHADYGKDRCVAALALDGEHDLDHALDALRATGLPLAEITLPDRLSLFAEFFKWEVATAVAAVLLRVDPFDEPNVQESKDKTRALLHGALPTRPPDAYSDHLALWWDAAGMEPTPESILMSFFAGARPGMYLSLLAYLDRRDDVDEALTSLRRRLGPALGVPTLVGYGPRYLHSIGQLYKGGPPSGLFIVLTADHVEDVPIPGAPYTFGQLEAAQALGDVEVLQAHERPVLRVHLRGGVVSAIEALERESRAALASARD
ncbi:MAG: glucose-6-phosphate isomerase [Nitrospirae bacterium]|nr:glucose-6-phosphate isomerase [Nitrospirota bacterium]